MRFQPFQTLYAHLKGKDDKLFIAFSRISDYLQKSVENSAVNFGLSEERVASTDTSSNGDLWFDIDTGILYQIRGGHWLYVSGVRRGTFANIPILTAFDKNLLYEVTTGVGGVGYYHMIRWTDKDWDWGGAETGAHPIAGFPVAPARGWHLCDGSTTHFMSVVAGVPVEFSFVTPDLVGNPAYIKMGAAYVGSVEDSVLPTFAGTPAVISGLTSVVHGGAIQSGTGTSAISDHNHSFSESYTPAGSISLLGDPVANLVLLPYFRR